MIKLSRPSPISVQGNLTIAPLKGEASFSALMRTKPLVAWDTCMLHALAVTPPTDDDTQQSLKPCISLGLIVPKKVYALAVDRNRVRRVLRAQSQHIAADLNFSIHILFRFRSSKKGEKKSTPPNPHSAAFNAAVRQGLTQMVTQLALRQAVP
jgi:ribonuclease P protein component